MDGTPLPTPRQTVDCGDYGDCGDGKRLGLGNRDELAWHDGMLFVYDEPAFLAFWMKRMRFDIDIVWIRERRIVGIEEFVPYPREDPSKPATVRAPELADMVLGPYERSLTRQLQDQAEGSREVWTQMMDVNLKGMFLCCRELGKLMIEQESGCIINLSSENGQVGFSTGMAHYATTKIGAIGMTRSLAVEWGKHGIRVNAVGPGSILYVRATSSHSFIEIEEDMTLLVFFASGGPGS